jgi:hypothetical protein
VWSQPALTVGAGQWFVEPEFEQAARAWLEAALADVPTGHDDAAHGGVETVLEQGAAAEVLLQEASGMRRSGPTGIQNGELRGG